MRLLILFLTLSSAWAQTGIMRVQRRAAGGGTISVVNAACNGVASYSADPVTVPLSMTAGNKLLVGVFYFAVVGQPDSVKLSDGSNCTYDGGGMDTGTSNAMYLYHCAIGSGITSVSAARSDARFSPSMCAMQVSGLSTNPFDSHAQNPFYNSSSTTWQSVDTVHTPFTPTQGILAILVSYAFVYNGTYAIGPGSGYTMPATAVMANGSAAAVEYKIISSTSGSYNPDGTNATAQILSAFAVVYK